MMDRYSEVRRVRQEMSSRAGHDIRNLIASINRQWPDEACSAIDHGTKAEQWDATDSGLHGAKTGKSIVPNR